MSFETYTYQDGNLASSHAYTMVGRPINGAAERYTDEITSIGEDSAIILARQSLVGVFDGAGGATDIGSAKEAAMTAADAVSMYYHKHEDGNVVQAMEFARSAVIHNPAAGLCVGALAQIHRRGVDLVNAGDTAITVYDQKSQKLDFPVEPQSDISNGGDPANYLGRQIGRIPPPIPDATGHIAPLQNGAELYLMSDGVYGNWVGNTGLEDHHFEAAHDAYQLLDDAFRNDPHLRSKFPDQTIDWDQWKDEVQPYIEANYPPRTTIDGLSICRSLIKRKISWPFERTRLDDATVILVSKSDQ